MIWTSIPEIKLFVSKWGRGKWVSSVRPQDLLNFLKYFRFSSVYSKFSQVFPAFSQIFIKFYLQNFRKGRQVKGGVLFDSSILLFPACSKFSSQVFLLFLRFSYIFVSFRKSLKVFSVYYKWLQVFPDFFKFSAKSS